MTDSKNILITGGAGFIGVNTALAYAKAGHRVTVFDNLSRRGSENNLNMLLKIYPEIKFIKGDVRNSVDVETAIQDHSLVFHFAGQVAVTTSVSDPRSDFESNAFGCFNILEAVRLKNPEAVLIYSSTNKVYGGLSHTGIREGATRYDFTDRPNGICENEPLDFHSPYGCSKGSADQYVRDYGRIYKLKTIVFRQSCIYGEHQYGVEDQGWLAWFMIAALNNKPITIYGKGKQVRDILYIGDLTEAYEKAITSIGVTAGQIYNIGGGVANSISVWTEFGPILEELLGKKILANYQAERPGDQPIYISDIRKAEKDFGWKPKTGVREGLQKLYNWIRDNA